MVKFKKTTGDLFVGESAENSDRRSGDSQYYLYRCVVFRSSEFNIVLSNGYYPVKESHIIDNVYYPHFNEAKFTIEAVENDELNLFEENITLEYAVINNEIYIKSDSEITSYGGFHIVIDDDVYKVHDSLLMHSSGESPKDSFLNIESVSNPVKVENVATNYTLPIKEIKVRNLVENNDKNGALKIHEPKNVKNRLLRKMGEINQR